MILATQAQEAVLGVLRAGEAHPQRARLESDGSHGTAVRTGESSGHDADRIPGRCLSFPVQVPVPAVHDAAGAFVDGICATDLLLPAALRCRVLTFLLKTGFPDLGEGPYLLTLPS